MTWPHRERDAPGGARSRVTGAVCRLSVRELVHDRYVYHYIDLSALDSASASAAAGALGLGHAGADHRRHGEHLSEVAPGECGPLLGLVGRGGHGRLARALELVDVVAQEQGDATQLDVIADRSRGRSDDDRYVGDVMNPDRDLVRGRVAADIAAAVVVLADRKRGCLDVGIEDALGLDGIDQPRDLGTGNRQGIARAGPLGVDPQVDDGGVGRRMLGALADHGDRVPGPARTGDGRGRGIGGGGRDETKRRGDQYGRDDCDENTDGEKWQVATGSHGPPPLTEPPG